MKSLFLNAILAAATLSAAPAIGIVTASGHFTVGGGEVWGNATLFDGAVVETSSASSELALRNGVKVQLGAGSRAHVYSDHVALDSGIGQVAPAMAFEVDAAGYKIRGAGVRVAATGIALHETIEVASLTGIAKVFGNRDVLLATIPAGRHMNLAFQGAQTGALTRSGCLLYKDMHFILQDDNTQEVVELNGNAQDLSKNLGNRVEAKGIASTAKPAVSIATSVLAVSTVSPQSQGGCLVAASQLNAQTQMPSASTPTTAGAQVPAAPAASGGGMSTGAKVAIIGGIAAGAGIGAALALSHSKSSTSP